MSGMHVPQIGCVVSKGQKVQLVVVVVVVVGSGKRCIGSKVDIEFLGSVLHCLDMTVHVIWFPHGRATFAIIASPAVFELEVT